MTRNSDVHPGRSQLSLAYGIAPVKKVEAFGWTGARESADTAVWDQGPIVATGAATANSRPAQKAVVRAVALNNQAV
jgi:hypothetical protein